MALNEAKIPDYYLVLAAPLTPPGSSRAVHRPWCIQSAYLFDAPRLIDEQHARHVRLGPATSVLTEQWDAAEIYPSTNPRHPLSTDQTAMLELFHP